MSIKKYVNSAWQDISAPKKYVNSAWAECDSAKRYANGAWQEAWSNIQAEFNYRSSPSGTSGYYEIICAKDTITFNCAYATSITFWFDNLQDYGINAYSPELSFDLEITTSADVSTFVADGVKIQMCYVNGGSYSFHNINYAYSTKPEIPLYTHVSERKYDSNGYVIAATHMQLSVNINTITAQTGFNKLLTVRLSNIAINGVKWGHDEVIGQLTTNWT